MSLVSQVSTAFTRVGTEFKTLRAEIATKLGNATLTTTDKTVFGAINEINAKPSGTGGAAIADGATASGSTWSSTKIDTTINSKVAALVNGSPAALDTLSEFATALGNDASFATTTATALGSRLRVDVANQALTTTQKTNGQTNLDVYGKSDVGDPTTDFSGQFVAALV